jgi:hypothetical protein
MEESIQGVQPVKIQPAQQASLCSVFIKKICATPNGDGVFGKATGFLYRDINGRIWLITNWHVITARLPDDPGFLVGEAPQSPYKIEVTYSGPEVGKFIYETIHLYRDGRPIWREFRLDLGIDLVGIPIALPRKVISPCVQAFAERDIAPFQPGMDVVIVGFPFEQDAIQMPFPIWKRAMVASEPGYTVLGQVQTLLDTPGNPGMSGSPVYRVSPGMAVTTEEHALFKAAERGERDLLEVLSEFNPTNRGTLPMLSLVGVYVGTTGKAGLERLSLGRMMLASCIDLVTVKGEPGHNPFPPIVDF